MAQHTELGYEKIACELTEQEHEIIKNICLYHHERSDGSGKNGMTDLPMYLRIVSLGDVFDALYSDRVYRKGLSYYETMDIIKKGGSGHFDDDVIDILETATSDLRDKVR